MCTLLSLIGLTSGLFTAGLYRLTARQPAIDLATTLVASAFSPNGLDDPSGVTELQAELDSAPNGELRPLENINVVVRQKDIAGKSPREIRIYLFRQITEPLYDLGPAAVEKLAPGLQSEESFASELGVAAIFTATSHHTIGVVLVSLLLASAACLVVAILFSRRFGRLVTPAVALLVASLPGMSLLLILSGAAHATDTVQPVSLTTSIVQEAVPFVLTAFKPIYIGAILVAGALLLTALVGKIILRVRARTHTGAKSA